MAMKVIIMMRVYNENNEQQQLPESSANSCYKIVSPILLQKLINDFATILEHFYLLKMSTTVFETRTTYFKKELHFLIDQPRTFCFFMLCCIKSTFLNYSGNQFSLYRLYRVYLENFTFARQR